MNTWHQFFYMEIFYHNMVCVGYGIHMTACWLPSNQYDVTCHICFVISSCKEGNYSTETKFQSQINYLCYFHYLLINPRMHSEIYITFLRSLGYWRQRADERLDDPPPKVDPGAFSGQRQGWKIPKKTLWQCTASVRVAGVHFWEISLG